jgi:hypothetical protein
MTTTWITSSRHRLNAAANPADLADALHDALVTVEDLALRLAELTDLADPVACLAAADTAAEARDHLAQLPTGSPQRPCRRYRHHTRPPVPPRPRCHPRRQRRDPRRTSESHPHQRPHPRPGSPRTRPARARPSSQAPGRPLAGTTRRPGLQPRSPVRARRPHPGHTDDGTHLSQQQRPQRGRLACLADTCEWLRQNAFRDGRLDSLRHTSATLRTTVTALAISHHLSLSILRHIDADATALPPGHRDSLPTLLHEAAGRADATMRAFLTVRSHWRHLHTIPPDHRADPLRYHAETLVLGLGRLLHDDPTWQPAHGVNPHALRHPTTLTGVGHASDDVGVARLLGALRQVSATAASVAVEHCGIVTTLHRHGRLATSDPAVVRNRTSRFPTTTTSAARVATLTHAYEQARACSATAESVLAACAGLTAVPGHDTALIGRLLPEEHRPGIDRSEAPAASAGAPVPAAPTPGVGITL